MTAQELLKVAPADWKETVDAMSTKERGELNKELDGIAERAALLAGYLDERYGGGCGDQGHKQAMKTANRNGKMVWTKVLGYNDYHKLTI